MNKYLTKIAKNIISKELPYRDRVEVLISKGDNVLVTQNKNKDTGETWFAFPGGGLDGDPANVACEKECLEEVGIQIKNIRKTDVSHKQEGGLGKKEDRHLKFRGSFTRWYLADFDKVDRQSLGEDGDSRRYTWLSLPEALRAIKKSKLMSIPRVNALNALKASKEL